MSVSGRGCRHAAAGQGKGGKKASIASLVTEAPGALFVSKVAPDRQAQKREVK